MEPKRRAHYFAHIPTIALFLLLGFIPQLAIILFILKAIDKDAERKEEAAFRDQAAYTSDFRATDTREPGKRASAAQNYDSLYGHDHPTDEQRKAKKRHQTLITLCTIAGAVLVLASFGQISDAMFWLNLSTVGGGTEWRMFFSELLPGLAQLIGGGGALAVSLQMRRTRKLERQLDKVVGDRDNIPLDELFAAAGVRPDQGRRVLDSAIDHGYFGADAYIDNRTDILVVRGPAPAPKTPEPAPVPKAAEDQYARLLRQLREVNDAIPDPVMSAKIARLEQVSARIFALAEKDPSKKPQLQKFMDYYLPTSLKLLNTYAQMDQQGVQGQNITEAKQSIERSMDMLVSAFENQLDKLFQSDALDISTDIAALQGMLNLDGLTGEHDFAQNPSS